MVEEPPTRFLVRGSQRPRTRTRAEGCRAFMGWVRGLGDWLGSWMVPGGYAPRPGVRGRRRA